MSMIDHKGEVSIKPSTRGEPGFEIPEKLNKSQERKLLKSIEVKVKAISKECEALSQSLGDDLFSMEMGLGTRAYTDLTTMQTQIMLRQSELKQMAAQLTKLTKYQQSSRLALAILSTRRRLEFVEKTRTALSRLEGSDLPKVYQLQKSFNEQLVQAAKEKNSPAKELYSAMKLYFEIGTMLAKPLSPEEREKVEAVMRVMRLKMTALSKEKLELSKKEQKIIRTYETANEVKPKDAEQLREALLKLILSEKFFPHREDKERYNTVNRWIGGLQVQTEKPINKTLLDGPFSFQPFKTLHIMGVKHSLLEQPSGTPLAQENVPLLLEENIQAQPVDKKTRKWSHVSVGLFDRKDKEVLKVAKEVENLGIRFVKTSQFLNQRILELSSGRIELHDALQEIAELTQHIRQAESRLEKLREEIASRGYDKVGAKVENVIAKQLLFIDALKRKHAVLSNYAEPKFYDAVLDYNAIISCVEDSLKDEKEAGYRLFEAHHKLEHLKDLVNNFPSTHPLKEEIGLLLNKGESAIQSALSENCLALTSRERTLMSKLGTSYGPKDLKRFEDNEKAWANIAIVLSKQLTEAMYYYQAPIKEVKDAEGKVTGREVDKEHFETMMAGIESAIDNISTLSPRLWNSVLRQNNGELERIWKNYLKGHTFSPERAQGVAMINNAKKFILQASSEEDSSRIGVHLSHARNAYLDLYLLRKRCDENVVNMRQGIEVVPDLKAKEDLSKKADRLAAVEKNLEQMGKSLQEDLEGAKSLNRLTKHKARLRQRILEGKIGKLHNKERTSLILSREVAKGLFAESSFVFTELVQMLRSIERKNPGLMKELSDDLELQSVMQDAINFLQLEVERNVQTDSRTSREALIPLVDTIRYLSEKFPGVGVTTEYRSHFHTAVDISEKIKPKAVVNPFHKKLGEAYEAVSKSVEKGFITYEGGEFKHSMKKPTREQLSVVTKELFSLVQKASSGGTGHLYFEQDGKPVHLTSLIDLLQISEWGRKELIKPENKTILDGYFDDGLKMTGIYLPKMTETLRRQYSQAGKPGERLALLKKLGQTMRTISANKAILTGASPVEFGMELKEAQASFKTVESLSDVRNKLFQQKLEEEIAEKQISEDSKKLEAAKSVQSSALNSLKMVQSELYATESSFSANIGLLAKKEWPLSGKKGNGTIFDALEDVKAITPEEKEVLSQGWEEFAEMSRQIHSSLEGLAPSSGLSASQRVKIVHDTFTPNNIDDFFNLFTVIVNNYNNAREVLNKAEANPDGHKLLLQFKKKNPTAHDVSSILIQPVQRAPRYEMLIKEHNKFSERAGLHPEGVQRLDAIFNTIKERIGKINKLM